MKLETMQYQTIQVTPLTPTIGAEIAGVDLAKPLTEQQFEEIHAALIQHLVIFFREQTLSTWVAGEVWHSDVTCETEPPMGSILHITKVPDNGGGDTLFANMYRAYELLSDPMRQFLEGKTAMHEGAQVYAGRQGKDPNRQYPVAEHPIVRTHPVSGKKALYINRNFTTRIVGLNKN